MGKAGSSGQPEAEMNRVSFIAEEPAAQIQGTSTMLGTEGVVPVAWDSMPVREPDLVTIESGLEGTKKGAGS